MASTASSPAISVLVKRTRGKSLNFIRGISFTDRKLRVVRVCAGAETEGAGVKPEGPAGDSRIHWENEEEGWLGVNNTKRSSSGSGTGSSKMSSETKPDANRERDLLAEQFADLLNDSADSHYQFLGVPPQADLEEIKAAYRRLSKEYHPDTTSLPIKAASDKFMRLREIYDVLSDEEKRSFYDWTLAQEVASRQAEKMRVRLQDPYTRDVENWVSIPDTVDRLGGKNMPLSDQAMSALTIDIAIIIFAIGCIVYVLYFKGPY